MKQSVLLTLSLAVAATLAAQVPSEAALLKKAREKGITAAEYPAFAQRERAKAADKTPQTPYYGSYSKLLGSTSGSRPSSASSCGNVDFEDANYNGWSVFSGFNNNSSLPPSGVVVDASPSTSGANPGLSFNAVIDSANSFEPNSSLSLISNYPGKHIARINHISFGAQAAILERQINVTSAQPYLNFSYAAFLEDGSHSASDQPYMRINMIDANNNPIPGTSLLIVAGSNNVNPGFSPITINGTNYYYKLWTPVSVNLTAYIGQAVTLQVTSADCTAGGHGGHAYIDLDCGGPTAAVPNVWPGDANYDLTVDFLDLFYVGAGSGLTGTSRLSPGNTWAAAPSTSWNQNSLYLVDAKHADCDGNGTVGASDTVAIYLNYGLGHAFKSNVTELTAQSTAVSKPVSMTVSADSVYAGQPFTLSFQIGNSSDLTDSIYAIGFSMAYPTQWLNTGYSSMNCNTSVIANAGLLNLFKATGGSVDLAIAKTNQLNTVNVQGNLFTLNLKAAAFIPTDTDFEFALSNLKAITRSGAQVPLTNVNASIKFKAIVNVATGLASNEADGFSIYPNPVQNKLTVIFPESDKIREYEIYSVSGALLKTGAMPSKEGLDVSELENGYYFIQLKTTTGSTITRRFIKS